MIIYPRTLDAVETSMDPSSSELRSIGEAVMKRTFLPPPTPATATAAALLVAEAPHGGEEELRRGEETWSAGLSGVEFLVGLAATDISATVIVLLLLRRMRLALAAGEPVAAFSLSLYISLFSPSFSSSLPLLLVKPEEKFRATAGLHPSSSSFAIMTDEASGVGFGSCMMASMQDFFLRRERWGRTADPSVASALSSLSNVSPPSPASGGCLRFRFPRPPGQVEVGVVRSSPSSAEVGAAAVLFRGAAKCEWSSPPAVVEWSSEGAELETLSRRARWTPIPTTPRETSYKRI